MLWNYEYAILSKPRADRNRWSMSQVYENPSFPSVPARALAARSVKGISPEPLYLIDTQTLLRSDAYCRCRGSLGCLSEKVGSWGYPASSLSSYVRHFEASRSLSSETDSEDQPTQTQKDNSLLKTKAV